AYYSLIVAGLFALYLSFEETGDSRGGERALRLGMALAAVLIGFGVAAIQILPFFEYIPYSPRAQGFHGFEGSTSYAIPWSHVPEFFIKNFVGWTPNGTYWGANPIKLHSEYLGLLVVALAVLGATARRRRRMTGAVAVGPVVTLLGITGAFGQLAEGFASGIQAITGRNAVAAAAADGPAILWGAASSGLALAAVALVLGYGADRLTPRL